MIAHTANKNIPPRITTRRAPAVQGAAAFAKGIAVLQLISEYPEPPTINELMASSDLTRPTLYRLLKALESEGLVECTSKKWLEPETIKTRCTDIIRPLTQVVERNFILTI